MHKSSILDTRGHSKVYFEKDGTNIAADPLVAYMNREQLGSYNKQS